MIKIRTLGTPVVSRDGHAVNLQPKRLGLLVFLALADKTGFQRRDALLSVFWPDDDQAHGRASLRQALRGLRKVLGDGLLTTSGDEVVGIRLEHVTCDARSFDELVDTDPAAAVALDDGFFLQGFHLNSCPDFSDWMDGVRARIKQSGDAAVRKLASASTHSFTC